MPDIFELNSRRREFLANAVYYLSQYSAAQITGSVSGVRFEMPDILAIAGRAPTCADAKLDKIDANLAALVESGLYDYLGYVDAQWAKAFKALPLTALALERAMLRGDLGVGRCILSGMCETSDLTSLAMTAMVACGCSRDDFCESAILLQVISGKPGDFSQEVRDALELRYMTRASAFDLLARFNNRDLTPESGAKVLEQALGDSSFGHDEAKRRDFILRVFEMTEKAVPSPGAGRMADAVKQLRAVGSDLSLHMKLAKQAPSASNRP